MSIEQWHESIEETDQQEEAEAIDQQFGNILRDINPDLYQSFEEIDWDSHETRRQVEEFKQQVIDNIQDSWKAEILCNFVDELRWVEQELDEWVQEILNESIQALDWIIEWNPEARLKAIDLNGDIEWGNIGNFSKFVEFLSEQDSPEYDEIKEQFEKDIRASLEEWFNIRWDNSYEILKLMLSYLDEFESDNFPDNYEEFKNNVEDGTSSFWFNRWDRWFLQLDSSRGSNLKVYDHVSTAWSWAQQRFEKAWYISPNWEFVDDRDRGDKIDNQFADHHTNNIDFSETISKLEELSSGSWQETNLPWGIPWVWQILDIPPETSPDDSPEELSLNNNINIPHTWVEQHIHSHMDWNFDIQNPTKEDIITILERYDWQHINTSNDDLEDSAQMIYALQVAISKYLPNNTLWDIDGLWWPNTQRNLADLQSEIWYPWSGFPWPNTTQALLEYMRNQ